jgi:Cof subfamily protein (haloacid dehalogenase superfamily)
MRVVAEQTGHHGIAVCANGAVVYDLHTEQVLESSLLPAAVGREVAAALRAAIPGIGFAVEPLDRPFAHEPEYVPRWDSADPRTTAPIDELLAGDVVKLLARHEGLGADELLAAAVAAVGDAATLTHSSSDGLLEISAAGVSKATGLARLASEHGVDPGQVVAFGDMPNDLPMLTWAGLGVAVANAHPAVLEVADEVTASNDDDGVALVLERLLAG